MHCAGGGAARRKGHRRAAKVAMQGDWSARIQISCLRQVAQALQQRQRLTVLLRATPQGGAYMCIPQKARSHTCGGELGASSGDTRERSARRMGVAPHRVSRRPALQQRQQHASYDGRLPQRSANLPRGVRLKSGLEGAQDRPAEANRSAENFTFRESCNRPCGGRGAPRPRRSLGNRACGADSCGGSAQMPS